MGKRRLKQSDEEVKRGRRKKRLIGDYDDDDDDEEGPSGRISGAGGGDGAAAEEEGEPVQDDAKPVGNPIRVSGKGKSRKTHYGAFEFNEKHFELEDSVLIAPEDKRKKPYVAIIKDITQTKDGTVMVTGQWFYRPEEIEKKGGSWESHDSRVLFYSFHHDDVPAEAAMHKCVVHFVPLDKQLPVRSVHPGFIVQGVYDAVDRKIWKLTDKDYEEIKQHEIDMLIQKTQERMGKLPEHEVEDVVEHEDQLKRKQSLGKENMQMIDVSRDDDVILGGEAKTKTRESCSAVPSELYMILLNLMALTWDSYRNKWLEKLLQGIQSVCSLENVPLGDELENSGIGMKAINGSQRAEDKEMASSSFVKAINRSQRDIILDGERFCWPDDAVAAVIALERASHDSLGSNFQKYNQKMRQLDFNLKTNVLLAKRLLNKELEPSVILNMSPNELKDGLTADEKATRILRDLNECR